MNTSLLPFLEIRLQWAGHHRWSAGETLRRTPPGPTLWLVQDGEAHVTLQGKRWHVTAGEAFLVPARIERDIVTPRGAQWLSGTFGVWAFRQVELLGQLALPAQWRPDEDEKSLLDMGLRQLVAWHGGARTT